MNLIFLTFDIDVLTMKRWCILLKNENELALKKHFEKSAFLPASEQKPFSNALIFLQK